MYKGQLEGFPREVVEKMLERQVEQGNKRDVKLFESFAERSKYVGGFKWHGTREGQEFWGKVIVRRDFDLFFERYPKELTLPEKWYVLYSNKEEFDIINKHFNKEWEYYDGKPRGYHNGDSSNNWIDGYYKIERLKSEGFTEITFEQFKKYVMKEEKLIFPREMLVWDNNKTLAKTDLVFGIFPERESGFPVIGHRSVYMNAEEIPTKSPRDIELEKLESQIEELKQQVQKLREV
jgi:hypothetical protein